DDAVATPPFDASATFSRGVGAFTTIEIAAEVVARPRLSVATAVRAYVPAGTLDHVMPNGATVEVPIGAPLAKNATLETEPSLSAAFAEIEIAAGSLNAAPAEGAVIETVGGVFGGGVTGAEIPHASTSMMRA